MNIIHLTNSLHSAEISVSQRNEISKTTAKLNQNSDTIDSAKDSSCVSKVTYPFLKIKEAISNFFSWLFSLFCCSSKDRPIEEQIKTFELLLKHIVDFKHAVSENQEVEVQKNFNEALSSLSKKEMGSFKEFSTYIFYYQIKIDAEKNFKDLDKIKMCVDIKMRAFKKDFEEVITALSQNKRELLIHCLDLQLSLLRFKAIEIKASFSYFNLIAYPFIKIKDCLCELFFCCNKEKSLEEQIKIFESLSKSAEDYTKSATEDDKKTIQDEFNKTIDSLTLAEWKLFENFTAKMSFIGLESNLQNKKLSSDETKLSLEKIGKKIKEETRNLKEKLLELDSKDTIDMYIALLETKLFYKDFLA